MGLTVLTKTKRPHVLDAEAAMALVRSQSKCNSGFMAIYIIKMMAINKYEA